MSDLKRIYLDGILHRARTFVERSQSVRGGERWQTTVSKFEAGEIHAMTQEVDRLRAENAELREALEVSERQRKEAEADSERWASCEVPGCPAVGFNACPDHTNGPEAHLEASRLVGELRRALRVAVTRLDAHEDEEDNADLRKLLSPNPTETWGGE